MFLILRKDNVITSLEVPRGSRQVEKRLYVRSDEAGEGQEISGP
jgi:hypothetical protein